MAATAKAAPHIALVPWIRIGIALVLGGAIFALVPPRNSAPLRALWGWDGGVLAMIVTMTVMMARSTTDHMRRRAASQDPGRSVILVAIIAGAMVSMFALAFVQKALKSANGTTAILALATIFGTILLSWFLVHVVFSLHYAHAYYGPAEDEDDADGLVGGLEFPSEPKPDYWDFMYFSFVVGMTCQVSDVQISGRQLRRLALFHGIVSFFFNTIILALTINILASAL
jgi:uncharacterized membrane protein